MSRQFDFSRLFLLLEAFDLLGQHLYGREWIGTEPWACPTRLEELRAEKRRLRVQLQTLRAEIAALEEEWRDALDGAESEQIGTVLHEKRQVREQIAEEARSLPDLTGSYGADQEAYERRRKTEETFLSGLRTGAIELRFGPDQIIHWPTWRGHPDFLVSFALSLARAPLAISSRRRAPLLVARAQFGAWLEETLPITEEAQQLTSPEQRCVIFLKEEVAKGKQSTKSAYRTQALGHIDGLQERAFNRVWDATVPPEWKRSGRPRSGRSTS